MAIKLKRFSEKQSTEEMEKSDKNGRKFSGDTKWIITAETETDDYDFPKS